MIKHIRYCDRCGKECEFIRDTLGYKLIEHDTEIDLCQGCYDSLNRWLKENEEVSLTGSEGSDKE